VIFWDSDPDLVNSVYVLRSFFLGVLDSLLCLTGVGGETPRFSPDWHCEKYRFFLKYDTKVLNGATIATTVLRITHCLAGAAISQGNKITQDEDLANGAPETMQQRFNAMIWPLNRLQYRMIGRNLLKVNNLQARVSLLASCFASLMAWSRAPERSLSEMNVPLLCM